MKKTIAFILLFSAYSMAINPFTYKWTIRLTGDTATVVKWKANNDSVLNWATRISDTVTHMPHWIELLRGDSTFHRIKADTISSNPMIDSIKGLDVIAGNPVIDSIKGMDVISGNPVIDSIRGMDNIRGNPDIDSISGKPIFTDTVKLMSSINVLGNKSMFGAGGGRVFFDFDGIGFNYNSNSNATGYINLDGYLNGNTQYRDLIVANGKGNTILFVDGSDSSVTVPKLKCDTLSFTHLARDTTFPCTLFVNNTFSETRTARAHITDGLVHLHLAAYTDNVGSAVGWHFHIPANIQTDGHNEYIGGIVIEESGYAVSIGYATINTTIVFKKGDASEMPSGASVSGITLQYFLN